MKRVIAAVAVIVSVSMSTFAGEIPTMGAPTPPPQQTTTSTNPGEIPTDGAAITISDVALSALMTALGLASI